MLSFVSLLFAICTFRILAIFGERSRVVIGDGDYSLKGFPAKIAQLKNTTQKTNNVAPTMSDERRRRRPLRRPSKAITADYGHDITSRGR